MLALIRHGNICDTATCGQLRIDSYKGPEVEKYGGVLNAEMRGSFCLNTFF